MQQLLNTNVRAKAGASRVPRLLHQGWQSRSVTPPLIRNENETPLIFIHIEKTAFLMKRFFPYF
jgi:hypothetical protein